MPNNFLITGAPGSGKSTVVKETVELLEKMGFRVGGLYCPEIRLGGERVGFKMLDIATGEERILAHIDQPSGPRVGKYKVDLKNLDEMAESAIGLALREADVVVVDEIAPMEMNSEVFKRAVKGALDSQKPVLAAIHQRTTTGVIGEVKSRPDVRLFEVGSANRGVLSTEIARMISREVRRETEVFNRE